MNALAAGLRKVASLGEAGVPHTDEYYSGDYEPDSVLSLDYYREKAREFQDLLNHLDATASLALQAANSNISESLSADLVDMLNEYDMQKWTLRTTAEAINLGAATVNAAGGRFPELSIPSGLGLFPIAFPVAAVAAVGVAATLISWGVTWINGVNERLKIETYSGIINDPDTPPETKQALTSILSETERIAAQSSGSGLASIANIVKWAAMGVGVFFVYKLVSENRRN